jgi:hypothetical protein
MSDPTGRVLDFDDLSICLDEPECNECARCTLRDAAAALRAALAGE